jgi:hypothetical protein
VPLDANSEANALEITQSHFGFTTKGDEWEGVCTAQEYVKMIKNAKRVPQESATTYL